MKSAPVAVIVVTALGLAACSAGPRGHAAPPPTAGRAGVSTTSTAPIASQPTATTTGPGVTNVVVTEQIRAQLIAAGAALNHLSLSDFTGLAPALTYYAYDTTTKTYWAGAGLVPSPTSTRAQVSTQDDGAYLLFERHAGGSWTAYAVGLAGTSQASACPVTVPSAILGLWNWPPASCRPAQI